jgi:hypothetical protein
MIECGKERRKKYGHEGAREEHEEATEEHEEVRVGRS